MDDLLMRLLTPMNDMTLQQVFKERDEAADKIATLQARVAELEAERDDAVIKRAAWELEAKILQARAPELKPCPFCGSNVIFPSLYGRTAKLWGVLCNDCNAWIEGFDSKEAAIIAWNRRASLPPTDAEVMAHPKVKALVEKAQAALDLNDNTSPFGGELQRDRIERTVDEFRAALAAIQEDKP